MPDEYLYEALGQIRGELKGLNRRIDETLSSHNKRLEALEAAPTRRRERLHTYVASLICGGGGTLIGVGAALAAHIR